MALLPFANAPGTTGGTSPLTTKGDLYGFSTVGVRVPVGINGQVLQSDSTNANGVSWITSGASFITSITTTGTSGAATVTSGILNVPQYASTGGVTKGFVIAMAVALG